jgi:hypothetical protein
VSGFELRSSSPYRSRSTDYASHDRVSYLVKFPAQSSIAMSLTQHILHSAAAEFTQPSWLITNLSACSRKCPVCLAGTPDILTLSRVFFPSPSRQMSGSAYSKDNTASFHVFSKSPITLRRYTAHDTQSARQGKSAKQRSPRDWGNRPSVHSTCMLVTADVFLSRTPGSSWA